jgi:SAM-dependent methyltransferase
MILPAPPYSRFVVAYDGMVGVEFFRRVRRAFETLARRYDLRFGCAADIGCGTGLFACYLNHCWGVTVYGVDRSPEMLRVAECRCGGPGVRFLRQDIRELCLPEPVDLVTANFDTMNHLITVGDLRLAFRRVADNLRTGGHFYFDIITPCRPLGGLRTYRRALCTAGQSMEQRVRWEPTRRLIQILVVHRRHTSGGCPVIERHTERAYSPGDVGESLLDAGFVIRGVHDEATLRFPPSCPPRLIVLARRSKASSRDSPAAAPGPVAPRALRR